MPIEMVTLIILFFVFCLIPCAGAIWIGWDLIERLGRYPSKTPSIQMSILLKLVILEVVSFTLIIALFKVLSPEA